MHRGLQCARTGPAADPASGCHGAAWSGYGATLSAPGVIRGQAANTGRATGSTQSPVWSDCRVGGFTLTSVRCRNIRCGRRAAARVPAWEAPRYHLADPSRVGPGCSRGQHSTAAMGRLRRFGPGVRATAVLGGRWSIRSYRPVRWPPTLTDAAASYRPRGRDCPKLETGSIGKPPPPGSVLKIPTLPRSF